MDQLIALQEIYESFSKGGEMLQSIDAKGIEGGCSGEVAQLLDGSKKGEIDSDICLKLASCLQDSYELKRLGDICRKAGLLEMAIRCYNRGLDMAKDRGLRPVLQNNLGQAYARYGDLARAIVFYNKAARGFESSGDRSGQAHVLGNLGSAYRKCREWDMAIEYSRQSLEAFQDLKDEIGAAQMTGSLGRVYAEMGHIDIAKSCFETSLKEFERLGDKKSAAWILNRLGRMSAEERDWEIALEYYQKSLSIFDELGQEQSSAIVLYGLGRLYLDQEQPALARDCLERSLKVIRKDLQPAYQNALSCLAAAYNMLAKANLNKKSKDLSEVALAADKGAEDSFKIASQYYSRASDRYMELASFSKIDLPEIYMAAHISRSLNYLAAMQGSRKDEDAALLADGAISSLEDAAAVSDDAQSSQIHGLQKILTGMKGIWSISMMRKEPWRLTGAVEESIEHLIEGASLTGEASSYTAEALQRLREALQEEQERKNPSAKLKSAAISLRHSQRSLQVNKGEPDNEGASQIEKAALILESLEEADAREEDSHSTLPLKTDLLNYRAHRAALLLIGWSLVRNALRSIDQACYIYSWDDSMNLIEKRHPGQPRARIEPRRIHTNDSAIEDAVACEETPSVEGESSIEPSKASTENGSILKEPDIVIKFSEPEAPKSKDVGLVPVRLQLASSTQSAERTHLEIKRRRINDYSPIIADGSIGEMDNSGPVDGEEPKSAELEAGDMIASGFDMKQEEESSQNISAGEPIGEQFGLGSRIFTKAVALKALAAIVLAVFAIAAIDLILYLI